MKFTAAIDLYLDDMKLEGRINGSGSERSYRDLLNLHAEDVSNRDPRTVGREDVKRTLGRWVNPNTQRTRRAYLVSFYDWCMEEGHRKDNPARQTRRPKARRAEKYRLTRQETTAVLRLALDPSGAAPPTSASAPACAPTSCATSSAATSSAKASSGSAATSPKVDANAGCPSSTTSSPSSPRSSRTSGPRTTCSPDRSSTKSALRSATGGIRASR